MTQEVRLVVSVDTEEDNWTPTRNGVTVENIRRLPALHEKLLARGIHPTYFVAYSVTTTRWAADLIRGLGDSGSTEIGAHLHPWNTPPTPEPLVGTNTMTRNLPSELQRRKLEVLTEAHTAAYGERPTSFRAGRFGVGLATLRHLSELGYRVDSSVTPFLNWSEYDNGPCFGPGPLCPYPISHLAGDLVSPDPSGRLVEAPISVGYTRRNFRLWHDAHRACSNGVLSTLRLWGGLARLGIVRKVILSPETARQPDLVALASRVIESGCNYLHVFLHSSSLQPGCSPFAAREDDVVRLMDRLCGFIDELGSRYHVRGATVSAAALSTR